MLSFVLSMDMVGLETKATVIRVVDLVFWELSLFETNRDGGIGPLHWLSDKELQDRLPNNYIFP